MVTFVDLAARADAMLVQAQRRLGTLSAAEAVDAARELATLTRACRRILDDVLDARPIDANGIRRDGPATRAADAAHGYAESAARQLGHAAALNEYPDAPRAAGGPTPLLHGSARYMRMAEEFLQTHLTAGSTNTRAPKDGARNPLSAGQVPREMVALVGHWHGIIGAIATQMAKDVRVPNKPVGKTDDTIASLLRRAGSCAEMAATRIAEQIGPPRETKTRLALAPRIDRPIEETPSDRLAASQKALTRLRWDPAVRQGHASITSHRMIAGAAAGICEHAALLARQLAVRADGPSSVGDQVTTGQLAEASQSFADAGAAWRGAVWGCRSVHTGTAGVTAGAWHALEAATQLGRAVTVHDEWAPGMPPARLREPRTFNADAKQLDHTLGTLREIAEALAAVADDHCRTVQHLHRNGLLLRHPQADTPVTITDRHAAALADSYGRAAGAARQTVGLLSDAGPARRRTAAALTQSSFPAPPVTDPAAVAMSASHAPSAASATASRHIGGGRS